MQRSMRTVAVVLGDEGIHESLELVDGGGLDGLGPEPFLHGLLEAAAILDPFRPVRGDKGHGSSFRPTSRIRHAAGLGLTPELVEH